MGVLTSRVFRAGNIRGVASRCFRQKMFSRYRGLPVGLCLMAVAFGVSFPLPSDAFEPISVSPRDARVRLSLLGSYRGGMYSTKTPASPPGYDPKTRRLFLGSDDREAIDVVDISDPLRPRKLFAVDLAPYGGAPDSMATSRGIVAVTVKDPKQPGSPKRLLFFNVDGQSLAEPIALPGARRLMFTPRGDRLVVSLAGSIGKRDAGVAIVELGPVDRVACREGRVRCGIRPRIRIAGFAAFNDRRDSLIASGVRILAGVEAAVSQDLRPSTVTVSPDSRVAWVNLQKNNAIAVIDLDAAEVLQIHGLPYKDHNRPGHGLDASDRDDAIAIRPWPIRALYQPDGLAVVDSNGERFLVTANEGDPNEADGDEEGYARLMELELDPDRFPEAAALQREENLGRLKVSTAAGDADGDGDLDAIYALGGRSFSIWTADAGLVYDSGEDFERITAEAVPRWFNASESANDFDARSDDRGPEPEVLTVGKNDGRLFAFIGFERIGGVMVYDITNPRRPHFEQYINNRNFAVDPAEVCGEKGREQVSSCVTTGDLEPEGLLFIEAKDSPIGVPLLVVLHELSDSTTLYRIDRLGW